MTDSIILKTGFGQMDILNPTPEQVDIEDMLNNLSRIPRWCGSGELTVLQHSLWVAFELQRHDYDSNTIICGLLHDAHEYVTGDIPQPLLELIRIETTVPEMPFLTHVQARIQSAIESRFGLTFTDDERVLVNCTDRAARMAETAKSDALHVMIQQMDENQTRHVFYQFLRDYSIEWRP